MTNKQLTIIIAVFIFQSFSAANTVMNLTGCSLAESDFAQAIVGEYCDRLTSWKTYSILPSSCQNGEFAQHLKTGNLNPEKNNQFFLELKNTEQLGKPEVKRKVITDEVVRHIEEASKDLKKNEQFLLKINAHGASTCENLSNPRKASKADLGDGIQQLDQCQLSFMMQVKGDTPPVMIQAADIIPVLDRLQKRGIKVAVQLGNCYSGAAILPFAQSGICAQAYSPADSLMSMCGGDTSDITDRTGTADLAFLQACHQQPKKQVQDESDKFKYPADVQSCLFGDKKAKGTLDYLQNLKLQQNETITSMTDKMRAQDQTPNIPTGVDGPFWIAQQLSFIGSSPTIIQHPNLRFEAQPKCEDEFNDFMTRLTDNITQVSDRLFQEKCSMSAEIKKFTQQNQKKFKKYYQQYKKISDLKMAPQKLLADRLTNAQRQQLVDSNDDNELTQMALETMKQIPPEMINADGTYRFGVAKSYSKQEFIELTKLQIKPNFHLMKKNINVLESALFDQKSFLHPEMRRLVGDQQIEQLKQQIKSIPEEARLLLDIQRQEIMPLERQLYQQLKQSKIFQSCLELNKKMNEAAKNCQNFQMPR